MAKVIFAFPGMGKTPLAKKERNVIDLDFGHYREAHQVEKANESELYPSFVRLIKKYTDDGWVVLTNNPHIIKDVIHVVGNDTKVLMYLPQSKSSNLKYSAAKLGVDTDTIKEWVLGWKTEADEAGIPVIWLHTGLDYYLSDKHKTE